MSSSEIDDVLSSIRQLVSSDQRPTVVRNATSKGQPAEKLLLTPALRVVPQGPGSDQGRTTDAGSLQQADDETREILSLQEAFEAALRAEASRRAQTPLPLGAKGPDPADMPTTIAGSVPGDAPLLLDQPPTDNRIGVARAGATIAQQLSDYTLTGLRPVGEIADASDTAELQVDAPGEIAAEHAADDVPAPSARTGFVVKDHGPTAVADPMTFADTHDAPPALDMRADLDAGTEPAGDIGRADDIVGAFASVQARHGAAWADRAAAEAAAQIAKVETGAQVFDPDEEMAIDEEVLRDLVRDILREQLQGALGERITRNVRKLVRAELNRALLSRDME